MSANEKQVGGDHYKRHAIQHWDWAADRPYLEARCCAYIDRHQDKNGLQDMEKALHFMQKILEVRYGCVLEWNIKTMDDRLFEHWAHVGNPYANIDPNEE